MVGQRGDTFYRLGVFVSPGHTKRDGELRRRYFGREQLVDRVSDARRWDPEQLPGLFYERGVGWWVVSLREQQAGEVPSAGSLSAVFEDLFGGRAGVEVDG